MCLSGLVCLCDLSYGGKHFVMVIDKEWSCSNATASIPYIILYERCNRSLGKQLQIANLNYNIVALSFGSFIKGKSLNYLESFAPFRLITAQVKYP